MRSLVIAAVLFGAAWNSAGAEDPASVLARILVQKGTINSTELARVESAATPNRAVVLASILADKGVLSAADLAQVKDAGGPKQAAATTPPKQAAPAPPVVDPLTPPLPPPRPPGPPKVGNGPDVVADTKAKVSIYGTILLNAFSNTSLVNILDIPLFAGKQGTGLPGDDKTFGMTARQSRLGLKFQARDVVGAKATGQVEIDFLGGKAAFTNGINMDLVRLRLAYGRLDWSHWAFEAGQDWSVFAPLNPTTYAEYAIPGLSASGNLWIRSPQIRGEYQGPLGESGEFKWQFGVVDPNMGDFNTTVFTSGRNPDIGSRGRFPGGEQRLGFIFGQDRKYDVGVSTHYARGKNNGTVGTLVLQNPVDSWGVALDYSLAFTKWFSFSGEWFEGRALGIFSDASGESILPVGTVGAHGVESRGGWSQAQFNFFRRWQTNLGYGIDAQVNSNLRLGDRNKNQTYYGNLMFKYNPHLTFAWELRRFLTNWKGQPFFDEQGFHGNVAIAYIF